MKQRIQGIIIGFLVAAILFSGVVMAAPAITWKTIDVAYADYKIYVDGVKFESSDKNGVIEPFSYNGWIYAPFEHIAKALGKTAQWDGDTHTLYLGSKTIKGEGVKLSSLDYFTKGGWSFDIKEQERANTGDYYDDCFVYNIGSATGVSAPGTRDYLLNEQYKTISGTIFVTYDSRDSGGIAKLSVWGDGKLIYSSDDIKSSFLPKTFEVDISGVTTLKIGYDRAGWDGAWSTFKFATSNVILK